MTYVNVRRMSTFLTNFIFVDILAERRNSLRLDLEPTTAASIRLDRGVLSGQVCDISHGGLAIRTDERCELETGVEAGLTFMVPNLLQNTLAGVQSKGTLVEIVDEGHHDICRFEIEPDSQSESLISRYIFQRQVELIRELKGEK